MAYCPLFWGPLKLFSLIVLTLPFFVGRLRPKRLNPVHRTCAAVSQAPLPDLDNPEKQQPGCQHLVLLRLPSQHGLCLGNRARQSVSQFTNRVVPRLVFVTLFKDLKAGLQIPLNSELRATPNSGTAITAEKTLWRGPGSGHRATVGTARRC